MVFRKLQCRVVPLSSLDSGPHLWSPGYGVDPTVGKSFGSFCLRWLGVLCSLFLSSEGGLRSALQEGFYVQLMLVFSLWLVSLGAEATFPYHDDPCCLMALLMIKQRSLFQKFDNVGNFEIYRWSRLTDGELTKPLLNSSCIELSRVFLSGFYD